MISTIRRCILCSKNIELDEDFVHFENGRIPENFDICANSRQNCSHPAHYNCAFLQITTGIFNEVNSPTIS